jgi:hypothetical protein
MRLFDERPSSTCQIATLTLMARDAITEGYKNIAPQQDNCAVWQFGTWRATRTAQRCGINSM